jgi:hypothetical protein
MNLESQESINQRTETDENLTDISILGTLAVVSGTFVTLEGLRLLLEGNQGAGIIMTLGGAALWLFGSDKMMQEE